MTRRAKTLGLTLAATLALGASFAQAAQATPQFTGYETPSQEHVHTIIEGAESSEDLTEPEETDGWRLTVGAVVMKCNVHYDGTLLTGEGSELTVIPEFTSCSTTLGTKEKTTSVSITGFGPGECDYVFHSGTKLAAGEYTGTVDLKCEPGHQVEYHVGTKCTWTFPSQEGLKHVIYHTLGTHIVVDSRIEKMKFTTSGGLLNCTVANGEHEDGLFESKPTLQGFNTEGTPIDIGVSGE